jgi:hypothetical protein
MNFEDLLRRRAIERVTVTPREIGELLAVARRDIKTAENLVTLDLDWAFVVAYNSVLQLSIAYMAWLGFRPRGEGKHYNTFQFMEQALPDDRPMIKRLQKFRRKRNMSIYEQPGLVSEMEARDVIDFAGRYYREIETRLPREITRVGQDEEST